MKARVYSYPGHGHVAWIEVNRKHHFIGPKGLTLDPYYYKFRNQALHALSEILRHVGKDFHSVAPLPAGTAYGQRPRSRSKTRRKYGFYRIHKESLERAKSKGT